jgi:hypothetical protein
MSSSRILSPVVVGVNGFDWLKREAGGLFADKVKDSMAMSL